ncbi:MAG: glycosyltransferase family 2 protein [Nitrospinales bacterium]
MRANTSNALRLIMETHLYTLCWNEADMLGFFFRHYDPWVDRYFFYDDGSTDASLEILENHPKVEIRTWKRKFPYSFISSQWHWLNTVWHNSKGHADWVVIVDIDEYLFVPKTPMRTTLNAYKENGVALIPALGFEMFSEEFPDGDECLVKSRTFGNYENLMCKVSIFNPDKIDEMNFTGGRHFAEPVGLPKYPSQDEVVLCHYKNIGFERTLKKQNALSSKLGTYDISTGYGVRLSYSREKMRENWDRKMKECFHIDWSEFKSTQYPKANLWWRPITQWFGYAINFLRDPIYMLGRLKVVLINNLPTRKFKLYEQYIDHINNSPIRQQLFQLTVDGNKKSEIENPFVKLNKGSDTGDIIKCCYSPGEKELPDIDNLQELPASKIFNEKKYNKNFQLTAITSKKGFASSAVTFAKDNNIRLICRNEFLEYISKIET